MTVEAGPIEDNVPIPGRRGRPKYWFGTLEVGQSRLFKTKNYRQVQSAANRWKQTHPGWDYTSRSYTTGIRVWRTA